MISASGTKWCPAFASVSYLTAKTSVVKVFLRIRGDGVHRVEGRCGFQLLQHTNTGSIIYVCCRTRTEHLYCCTLHIVMSSPYPPPLKARQVHCRRLTALDAAVRAVQAGIAALAPLAGGGEVDEEGEGGAARSAMLAAAAAASPEHDPEAMDVLFLSEQSLVAAPQV